MKLFLLFIALQLFIFTTLTAQESVDDTISNPSGQNMYKGFYFGINVGVHFASADDAMYYNGGDDKPNTLNGTLNRLSSDGMTNKELLEQILNDDIIAVYPPSSMKYDPTVLFGANLGYSFNELLSLYLDINYVTLKTAGEYKLLLSSPLPQGSLPGVQNTVSGAITAKEDRIMFNLGVHKAFKTQGLLMPYFDIAFNFNYFEVKEHEMHFESNFTRSMIGYDLYGNQFYETQAGAGYGLIFGGGIQIPVYDKFYFMAGINLSFLKINLYDDLAGKDAKLHKGLILRFSL